jgi:hypothetical protein
VAARTRAPKPGIGGFGGSINGGANQSNTAGARAGDGLVTIKSQ